jgi:hypothetical protein
VPCEGSAARLSALALAVAVARETERRGRDDRRVAVDVRFINVFPSRYISGTGGGGRRTSDDHGLPRGGVVTRVWSDSRLGELGDGVGGVATHALSALAPVSRVGSDRTVRRARRVDKVSFIRFGFWLVVTLM